MGIRDLEVMRGSVGKTGVPGSGSGGGMDDDWISNLLLEA